MTQCLDEWGRPVSSSPTTSASPASGRFLRKYSLDELPQFWNVLKGDMSIVGPRPALEYEVEAYKPWHRRRLEVAPGVSGLWQIAGRSRVGFDEMVFQDVMYGVQPVSAHRRQHLPAHRPGRAHGPGRA